MLPSAELANTKLLSIAMTPELAFDIEVGVWTWVAIGLIAGFFIVYRLSRGTSSWNSFEIEQAEIGIGAGTIRFKPNLTDRQVAYSIWVELSTRKVGLPIDFDHDVVSEIFDSWYDFFGITRELVKTIPVQKVRQGSTQKIIKLSIDVLNLGLRPLLTKWQARFRRWYEHELNDSKHLNSAPQDIQKGFPQWSELQADMTAVNAHLMRYREKMRVLVMKG